MFYPYKFQNTMQRPKKLSIISISNIWTLFELETKCYIMDLSNYKAISSLKENV